MTALNAVRFRVKPGRENDFITAHKNMKEAFPGMRRAWLVKTGDRTFCMIGVWKEMKALTDARPLMIANLDKFRDMLEDMGGGLGVTDPASGEAVVELKGDRKGKKGKGKKGKAAGAAGGAGATAGAAGGKGGGAARKAARQAKKAARKAKAGAKGGGEAKGKK